MSGRPDGRVLALRAAKQRAHAGDELVGAERLGEVVVGAHLEADDALGFVGARGQHDDRNRRRLLVGAQQPADFESVDVRQHHIQHDQIRRFGCGPSSSASRPDETRVVVYPALSRYRRHQFRDVGIVLDDQDARGHWRYSNWEQGVNPDGDTSGPQKPSKSASQRGTTLGASSWRRPRSPSPGGGAMRAFLATVLSVIAVGVLLIAYGLLAPASRVGGLAGHVRPANRDVPAGATHVRERAHRAA